MKSVKYTFATLKKSFLDSGYEIRFLPQHELEQLSLDAPASEKRHAQSTIMGLIMPDLNTIGIAEELSPDERVTTLIHELVHLDNADLPEDTVESITEDIESELTQSQYGFLQFLCS